MADADVASPFPHSRPIAGDRQGQAKNASRREPTSGKFVSLPFGFFDNLWDFVI
ncbi:hypothetical protein NUH86_03225 [Sphingobium sp. JS3065]|jgi:hypothetical protein|uniref:hypothetical protein n=1 Tax=Sphingobium sp. JS3065 TaxID=2970925 RepID=UPI0022646355|nr:hypothetical protein [Sphingobium sp. JS3065]UZW55824.1 hypothetical protein NUH86_03225 [Sphingobium sp. JS3065]